MPPVPPRPRLPPEALSQGFDPTLYLHGTVGDVRRFSPARRGSGGGGDDSHGATYLVEADEAGVQSANSYAATPESRAFREQRLLFDRIRKMRDNGIKPPERLLRDYESWKAKSDAEIAEAAASPADPKSPHYRYEPGSNIIPTVTRSNPMVLKPSPRGYSSEELSPHIAQTLIENGQHTGYYNEDFYLAAQEEAARRGYDAVRFEQIRDGGGLPTNVLAVLDDATIRSPNAEFNPARRESNDLTAFNGKGGAPGAGSAEQRAAMQLAQRAMQRNVAPGAGDMVGGVDALASLASMLGGSIYGGYRGLSSTLSGLMSGESAAEASRLGAQAIEEGTADASWEPLTESGNEQLAVLAQGLEQMSAPATAAGQYLGEQALNLPPELGGGPAAGTLVDLVAQMGLDPTNFIGGPGTGGAMRNITSKQLRKALERATGPGDVKLPEVKRPPFESSSELQREVNMLAASNPGGKALPWEENVPRTQQMGDRLIEMYGPGQVQLARGVYGGEPEISFMVTPPEGRASIFPELQDLADEFGQDSVFNNRYGLGYGGERRGQTTPLARREPLIAGERWTRDTLPENWADVDDGPVPGDTIGNFDDFYTEINTPQGPMQFQYGLDFDKTGKLPEYDPRTVDATHWSPRGDLEELDPAMYGTGAAGKERGRVEGGDLPRGFGYARGPKGEEAAPEDVVASGASNRYFAQFPNVYDAINDPQGLAASSFNVSDLEMLAREGGYSGVLAPEPGEFGTVVGFDKVPLSRTDPLSAPPAPRGGGPRNTRYRALTGDPEYPGIYKPVNELLSDARAANMPESEALREVFGISRGDLDSGMRQFSERLSNVFPEFATKRNPHPRGSAAVEALDKPSNWQRIRDATEAGLEMPGVRGWYNTEPLFDKYLEHWGPELGPKMFARDMGIQAVASANTPVPMQAKRGMLAQYLLKQGVESPFRAPEFGKGSGFGTTTNPLQAGLLDTLLEEGRVRPESPGAYKIPTYYSNFLGHTDAMTLDAHQARNTGLSDMRRKLNPDKVDVGSNPAGAEYATLEQLLKDNVANPLGIMGAEAQPAQWVIYSPQTGVKSLGGPFLEEYARHIKRTSDATGMDPRSVLERIIMGDMRVAP